MLVALWRKPCLVPAIVESVLLIVYSPVARSQATANGEKKDRVTQSGLALVINLLKYSKYL